MQSYIGNFKRTTLEILDSSNDEIALQTINISIKSVQDRFDKYNNILRS